jgi:hypothetical protein
MVRKWANQQVAGKGRFSCNSWRTCALFRRLYPMALVIQQVVTFTASLAALWLVCPWRPTFAIFWTSGREILRFMFHTTPGGLIGMINQSCDTMLVAYFFGPASTGIYSVGKRLRLSLQLVPRAPINGIITPTSRGSVTLPNRSHHKSSGTSGSRHCDDFTPRLQRRCPEGSVHSC